MSFRIGIVSGKLGDVDGVSLEVDKWIEILNQLGHEVFTIAGRYASPVAGVPEERQILLRKIRFDSEEQRYYERLVFPHLSRRPPHLNGARMSLILDEIESEGKEIQAALLEYVHANNIDVLIAENTNAMPMTILGGLGVYKVATEDRVATIFHHHDFWWERSRFSNNRIEGLLNRIMPPVDLGLEHIVISSYAAHILSSLKRVQPYVIPNCEDFDNPVWTDEYNSDFRSELGFSADDVLFVQPTRVVPRKRIEDSLRLVAKLVEKYPSLTGRVQYIISLYQGDEPDENYIDEIRNLATELGIPFHMISDRVASVRGTDASGRKLYTNRDVLTHADFVTYLPIWEGFGNALLEAIAAKVPVVTTTYLVYKTDIMITGLRTVEVRDHYDRDGKLVIPDGVLEQVHRILTHADERAEIVEHNFAIAAKEFGYQKLKERLEDVLAGYGDEIRASRKRVGKAKARYSV